MVSSNTSYNRFPNLENQWRESTFRHHWACELLIWLYMILCYHYGFVRMQSVQKVSAILGENIHIYF
jgi:hypothetical protein